MKLIIFIFFIASCQSFSNSTADSSSFKPVSSDNTNPDNPLSHQDSEGKTERNVSSLNNKRYVIHVFWKPSENAPPKPKYRSIPPVRIHWKSQHWTVVNPVFNCSVIEESDFTSNMSMHFWQDTISEYPSFIPLCDNESDEQKNCEPSNYAIVFNESVSFPDESDTVAFKVKHQEKVTEVKLYKNKEKPYKEIDNTCRLADRVFK